MIKTTDVVRKTYSGEIANHSHPSLKHGHDGCDAKYMSSFVFFNY